MDAILTFCFGATCVLCLSSMLIFVFTKHDKIKELNVNIGLHGIKIKSRFYK